MSKPSSEKLVSSIKESSQYINAATLTFLALCVYIGIAVASTTHEVLLLGQSLGLPLFNVQIPLDKFYMLAPALLVILHLHLLLLDYLLLRRIQKYVQDDNPPEEETDLFFASLPLSIPLGQDHPGLIRVSLVALFTGVMVVLPVSLLLATQVNFLPYHSAGITTWHKLLILMDLWLIWYFALRIPDLRFRTIAVPQGYNLQFTRLPLVVRAGGVVLTLVVICLSIFAAGGRWVGYEFRAGEPDPFSGFFSQNLSLIDRGALGGMALEEKPEDPEREPGEESSSKDGRGLRLAGRNLRGADFTNSVLVNADFRGADLTGAVFRNADLRRAKFSPLRDAAWLETAAGKAMSERIAGIPTVLRGCDFRGAHLERADLLAANLRRANLEGAHLEGADLSLADLRDAYLREAKLRLAKLASASLAGTDLWRASLQGADLHDADLRGAKLVEADAIVADFSGANVLAADFRNARLYLAQGRGLTLEGVDLRGAHLGEVKVECGHGKRLRSPLLSDLRSIDFGPPSKDDTKMIGLLLKKMDEKAVYDKRLCLKVWDEELAQYAPLSNARGEEKIQEQFRNSVLLYNSQQTGPMKHWPQPTISEEKYDAKLAERLVNEACKDYNYANILIRDLSGDLVPENPALAYALALKMSEQKNKKSCLGLWSLPDIQKNLIERSKKTNPLRTYESTRSTRAGG